MMKRKNYLYNQKIEYINKYQLRLFPNNDKQRMLPYTLYDDQEHIKKTVNETSGVYRKNGFVPKLKQEIRIRDNCQCQLCGRKGVFNNDGTGNIILDVHHINYIKVDINPKNLITLCHEDHAKTNKHRVFWKYYFNKVITQIFKKLWVIPVYKEEGNNQLQFKFI